MSDLISRQDAIDAVETKIKKWNAVDGEGYHVGLGLRYTDVIDTLTELPSAQPDIIRCNACKHWTQTTGNMPGFGLGDCDYLNAKFVNCNGYCYWAERRQDE